MSMRDVSDLPRWLDSASDAPPELRAALGELAESSDDAALLSRLEGRLSPLFGGASTASGNAEHAAPRVEAASGAPSAAPAGATATGLSLKLGGLVLLGTGAIAAALGASRVEPREPSPRVAEPPASARLSTIAPPDVERVPAAIPSVPIASLPTSAPSLARSPVHRAAPVASAEPASGVAEEARLLRSAREATGTSLGQALSLLAEHERRFPRGELREERELFAIDVLTRAGRTEEAVARVERLRRTSPGSPHLVAAERLVSKTTGPR